MRVRLAIAVLLLVGAAIGSRQALGPEAAAAQVPAEAEHTGNVIVRFKSGTTLSGVGDALSRSETEAAATSVSGAVLVEPDAGQSVEDAVAALSAHPNVAYAEPDYVVSIDRTPNDPYYNATCNLGGTNYNPCQWHYPQIGLLTAWDTTTGSASTIVAVIDTGVQTNHAELDSKITTGANAGYDFVNNDSNPTDDHGHGTFVAGIIAAETDNSAWVAGVCWACKIMPIKVLGADGLGSSFNVAQGIDWARTHGAHVINLSLSSSSGSTELQNAVNNAWNAGIIVVAASGNNNSSVRYPAAYANAIAVGATTSANVRASFSNYGPELDVVAPGENVVSTLMGGGYGAGSGTSFAAPHVAGMVGLMMASGVTDKNEIVSRLTSTATDLGAAGFDNLYGWGLVNASAAILSAATYGVSWGADNVGTTLTPNTTVGANVTFTNTGSLTWSSANGVRFSYHWRHGSCPGASNAIWDGVRTNLSGSYAAGATVDNLAVSIRTPSAAGTYCLIFDLVREGIAWFSSHGASTKSKSVTITAPPYAVQWGSDNIPASLIRGRIVTAQMSMTNTGSLTWAPDNAVRFSYHWVSGSCPGTATDVWDGLRTAMTESIVAGATANVSVQILAPSVPGSYCLILDMVHDGVTWFSRQGAAVKQKTITIYSDEYSVNWQSVDVPATMSAGTVHIITASFQNTGTLPWSSTVRFAYHWWSGACPGTSTLVWDGVRTVLPGTYNNGDIVSHLQATILVPSAPATYCLELDLVNEGVAWFSRRGSATVRFTVTVN